MIVHALNTKRSFYPEKSQVKRAASVLLRGVGAEGGRGPPDLVVYDRNPKRQILSANTVINTETTSRENLVTDSMRHFVSIIRRPLKPNFLRNI